MYLTNAVNFAQPVKATRRLRDVFFITQKLREQNGHTGQMFVYFALRSGHMSVGYGRLTIHKQKEGKND